MRMNSGFLVGYGKIKRLDATSVMSQRTYSITVDYLCGGKPIDR